MSLTQHGPLFIAECDDCGDQEEIQETKFADALAELKRFGWRPRKTNSGWEHQCGACRRREEKKNAEQV